MGIICFKSNKCGRKGLRHTQQCRYIKSIGQKSKSYTALNKAKKDKTSSGATARSIRNAQEKYRSSKATGTQPIKALKKTYTKACMLSPNRKQGKLLGDLKPKRSSGAQRTSISIGVWIAATQWEAIAQGGMWGISLIVAGYDAIFSRSDPFDLNEDETEGIDVKEAKGAKDKSKSKDRGKSKKGNYDKVDDDYLKKRGLTHMA